ncbi:TPA: type II toxin-antitoxin system VapC family toxin [Streptococcus pyogenes]|nr:type II toxin-antitoxin system VapC family toxin [Streptococcus pyogenes]HER2662550.1 type II toxin-antitoxin system VapC family toxin [Streptococcus pyogenes]
MSTTVYDLKRFSFKPEEKLLVDVNVLLYLQTGETHSYDKMWELALKQGNQLYFTSLSVSEFINRLTKNGYYQYLEDFNQQADNFDFKRDYQKTKHFLDIYDDAIDTVETEIIPKMTILDYDNEDFKNISELTEHMLDINDALYLKKAISNDLAIVTHDRDFFNVLIPENIKIYTYNDNSRY